jgi:hypothetical protein
MKYSAVLSTVAGMTTASFFHDDAPNCCFDTLSGPCRNTVRAAAKGYLFELSPSRAVVVARRAIFERVLMRRYGITPADCVNQQTLDREIAEAVRDADWCMYSGVEAMINAVGDKFGLDRLTA